MSLQNLKNVRLSDGIVTSTGSAQQFANIPCSTARFKVIAGNTVFIGNSDPAFPLTAGDDSGWIGCSNLNDFYHSTGAGGSSGTVYYMIQWD